MSTPTKLGFLSLEFVVGEDTYWMTTGLGRPGFYFTQLPKSLFAGHELLPMFVSRETDYSEITPYADRNVFKTNQADAGRVLVTDLASWPRLSWNEMAARLMDLIPLADQSGLWHNHVVRCTDAAFLSLKDVAYKITAFLPPPDQQGILALYGEDYVIGTNPNWRTMELGDENAFKAVLSRLRIEAVHFNGEYYTA